MTSSALRGRTYGQPLRGRAPSPTPEMPFTPTEELSSWLPDDFCAACGAQVKASQLYCSDACRQKEGDHLYPRREQAEEEGGNDGHSSFPPTPASAPPNAKLVASTRHYFPNTTAADIDSLQRFRYPCPPSPLLFAQRRTSVADRASQTSLISGCKKESTASNDVHGGYARIARRTSSTDAYSEQRPHFGRRSSADSSDSSLASSSAFLTDPSTPSPGTANRGCDSSYGSQGDSGTDDNELDSGDFHLPPALTSSPAVILNTSQKAAYHHRSRSDRQVSPVYQHHRRPRTSVGGDNDAATATTTMSYARRPGTTNVPAPVLYSPVLVARHSNANANEVFGRRPQKARLNPRDQGPLDGAHAHPLMSTGGSSVSTDALHGATTDATRRGRSSSDTSRRVPLQRVRSDPSQLQLHTEGELSPQQHDSGGSGSSSAARTLRALSPGSLTSSGEICGRPGCSGTAALRSNPFHSGKRGIEPTHQEKGIVGIPAQSSGSLTEFEEGPSPRSSTRHKHTHSARASLSLHEHLGPAALKMTPAHLRQCDGQVSHAEQKEARNDCEADNTDDAQAQFNPRGRSKARGRRSISRRSRSPPRAAARGRSVALHKEECQRKGVSSDVSPSETTRLKSGAINIDLSSRRPSDDEPVSEVISPALAAIVTEDEDQKPRRGRGRSPAICSRRPSNAQSTRESPDIKGNAVVTEPRGRRSAISGGERSSKSRSSLEHDRSAPRPHIEKGFDDIENLELEA